MIKCLTDGMKGKTTRQMGRIATEHANDIEIKEASEDMQITAGGHTQQTTLGVGTGADRNSDP